MLCFKIGSCFTTLMGKYNVVFDRSLNQERERERERELFTHDTPFDHGQKNTFSNAYEYIRSNQRSI